ncbi:MAG TPA: peptidase U32 family protein [Rectinemataceae bacterium]|nr:peptidase U32 family protein [Rectinemataceae bacterium]
MKRVELLAPAGSPEALNAALGEGADAVYLGLRSFNARMRSANFAFNQFEAGLQTIHEHGKKVYVTVNTVFEERETDRVYQLLQFLNRLKPDGIIVQDLGVLKMARDNFPSLALHASTQMNVASSRGCHFLSRQGFKRAVLARELSLEEIRTVRQNTPLELEVFVHGALCVSASGVCLFSSYLGGKSANRGACTQACRRLYESETKKAFFFSPDDLQLIDYVPDLIDMGIDSFKIEGRMKSAEYVGTVVAAYRHLIDNCQIDRERALAKAKAMLQSDFARRKTTFFVGSDNPEFIHPDQAGGTGIHLGKVKDIKAVDEERWAVMSGFDGLSEGDSIRIHRSDDSGRVTAKIRGIKKQVNGMLLKMDGDWRQNDDIYLIQTASMARRYKNVLPHSLDRYRAFPSRDEAPRPQFAMPPKKDSSSLPAGYYALVGKVADLHAVLAAAPQKAMIVFDKLNAEAMRKNESTIPYKRDRLVLWLDPFYPESDVAWLEPELDYWISRGVRCIVANNLGHLGYLRGKDLDIIAGPWLYAFNLWAAGFLFDQGVRYLIPPMEISKQNFMRIAESVPPSAMMPITFSYPQLFRIRGDLSVKYDSSSFMDRDGATYTMNGRRDYTVVVPDRPFSIIDRTAFLRKEHIDKFILDLSNANPARGLFRDIAKAAAEGKVLPDASRFNWKDGFYNEDESAQGKAPQDKA